MAKELPYLISTKRLPELFTKIQSAAVPEKFTTQFLNKLGLTSSNERAYPSLLRKLGFLDSSGAPTSRYRAYRNTAEAAYVLAEGIREAYSELFSVNKKIHSQSKETVKGIVRQVTGVEDRYARLISTTFLVLCGLAKFDSQPTSIPKSKEKVQATENTQPAIRESGGVYRPENPTPISFRYNIEIHLPATTDIAVYNAIFKSLKEHLG